MMHSNSFVIGVRDSKRNVLREIGDKVFLPFHEEYSLIIKNNNAVRACCAVSIDGTDVLGGGELILDARGSIDLERFIVDGDLSGGQRFKFVPLDDGQVADPSEPKNGIIEVKFWKELPPPVLEVCKRPEIIYLDSLTPRGNSGKTEAIYTCNLGNSPTIKPDSCNLDMVVGEAGATVAGGYSGQRFRHGNFGVKDGGPTVIRLRMVGKKVRCPLTVQETKKIHCVSCGKKAAFNDNHCRHCGAKLKKDFITV